MASVARYVFGCCIRGQSPGPKEPDERTPFIQPTTDEVPPLRSYTVDHDRLNEQLGTIVRAKEGGSSLRKMVNVNQPLPFNLHGRPHARFDRSVSANTTPPRASSSAAYRDAPHGHAHANRVPSYSNSREPSPSIQTSRSTSSLHPGDASYLPPESDPEGGSRRPILNVRLVRGPGGFFAGSKPRLGSVSRGRPGRPGEERGRENGNEAEGTVQAEDIGKGVTNGANEASDTTSSTSEEGSNHAGVSEAAAVRNGHAWDGGAAAQEHESSAFDSDFKIEDVGDIAQSWGD
ncbi:hypothetical protein C2E23DRAFT_28215 [Lenzites betulinus]|nr:hypothetical protein C2E23DRAFT_28215 [Lenzites betulinus]